MALTRGAPCVRRVSDDWRVVASPYALRPVRAFDWPRDAGGPSFEALTAVRAGTEDGYG